MTLIAVLAWTPAASAQSAALPPTPAPEPNAHRALVHLDGAPDALLQQSVGGDGQWKTVCKGPCDTVLPVGPTYRIDGEGIRTSADFHLPPSAGSRVTLDVSPASSARFGWGVALVPIGLLTSAVGCLAMYVAAIDSSYGGSEAVGEPGPPNYTPGAALVVVGAVAVIGGLVLLAHDWETGVQGAAPPPRPPAPLMNYDSAGGWRERSPEERALPSTTIAPLWGLRF
jgi:hypothetical protein